MKYTASMSKTCYGSYVIEAESYEEARELFYNTPLEAIDASTEWDEDYDLDLNCGGIQEYQAPNQDLWS